MSKLLTKKEAAFIAKSVNSYMSILDITMVVDKTNPRVYDFIKALKKCKKIMKDIGERKNLDEYFDPEMLEENLPIIHEEMRRSAEREGYDTKIGWG